MKSFTISVIMPLYNAEEYLRETVGYVLDQTLGFEENIQLILVNDGSGDGTEALCMEYASAYPDNVIYLPKENGGVSAARNFGIPHATGKYVTFLDKDDGWEKHAFARIVKFFDKHYAEIDQCVAKIENVGDLTDEEHPLNFKFAKGSRIIDLIKEPASINHTIGNVVFKREAMWNHRFDEALRNGEDSKFLNTLNLKKLRYGIVADAVFYYRRMRSGTSLSAQRDTSLYTEVPRRYYLEMLETAKAALGTVPAFIQETLLYNMRWRRYDPATFLAMREEEISAYSADMKEVFSYFDDGTILEVEKHHPYRKAYFLLLKHGEGLLQGTYLGADGKAYAHGVEARVLDYKEREVLQVEVLSQEGDMLNIQGVVHHLFPWETDMMLVVRDAAGTSCYADIEPYERGDMYGFAGEVYATGHRFSVNVPLAAGARYRFFALFGDREVLLDPTYFPNTLMQEYADKPYRRMGDFILKDRETELVVQHCNPVRLTGAETAFSVRQLRQKDAYAVGQRAIYDYTYLTASKGKMIDAPLFLTIRDDDRLEGNLKEVHDAYAGEKTVFAKRTPFGWKQIISACKNIYHHKVVLTDDYMYLFRRYPKREGQYLIQLWHACGAFKKFGLDGTNLFPGLDANTHRDYDLVSVSSEHVRKIYADAFGIDVEKVQALGCPRTDMFFDEERMATIREQVYAKHPELKGKEVLLYAPTFRDLVDVERHTFLPDLDFGELSDSMKENQVFVICPHPVMTTEIVHGHYDNILEIRDVATMDMMTVADLLITDYSSVIFEFSLLQKPIVFYCYDYDTYERDFYLDYEKDLPGELLRTRAELLAYLKRGRFVVDERQQDFVEKYMGACDGHSTERILAVIDEQLEKR